MRLTDTLIVAAGLALAASLAHADDPTKYDPRVAFVETDFDGDGAIDRAEFHVRIVEIFFSADRNRDGFLDADELKQLAFPEDFGEDDKDKNGRVSLREFLRVRFHDFDAADTDDDGVLSVDEVVVAFEGRKPR